MVDIPRTPKKKRGPILYASIGGVAVIGVTIALATLKPAAPTVDAATLWPDTVRRGPMVRQVRGPGTLVPEQIQWVVAVTAGRVERILVDPGAQVSDTTTIMVLSNPDVQIQALEAERQVTSAEANLMNLRATLENQRLNQEAALATVRSQYREAMRQAKASEELAKKGLIAGHELQRARDNAEELAARIEIEQKRLNFLAASQEAQLSAQASEINRLRGLAAFRREQLASMVVRAGARGVVTERALEVGQWATPGATLARVVQPGRLKAVLRIPETQAKDLSIGQRAQIDTRNGIIPGRVVRVDPAATNGTVSVDVALEGELPRSARPDLSVDGTIEIERLPNVLYVGRPAYGQAESVVGLFRLEPDGKTAVRTNVRLGRSSVNTIEIVSGLKEGDVVILSDMSAWDSAERVRLK